MSEDSTIPPWQTAGQAPPEAPAGSEPTQAEPFVPQSSVPPTVPSPAVRQSGPEPARDGEAGHQPPPWWAGNDWGGPVQAAPASGGTPAGHGVFGDAAAGHGVFGDAGAGPAVFGPGAAGAVAAGAAAPKRGRRGWLLAVAGVAVAALAAGLLAWAPWHQSPVPPKTVLATSRTATSVLVSWSASKGGAAPDHYLVLRDDRQVGSVPASRTSFTDTGLIPGSRHRYAVIATAGGQRSLVSVGAAVTTITPSPVGLTSSKATWTTVRLRWSPSPLGPVPDKYQIFSGTTRVAVVAGSVDSYNSTGLSPGGSYQYQVTAVWGHAVSAPSAPFTALTLAPPLTGDALVKVDTVSTPGNGASLSVGDHWTDNWLFAPACAATRCTLRANAQLAAPGFAVKPFKMTLRGSGGRYAGSANAQISQCGSVKVTNTITLSIAVKGAVTNGAWPAWTGTMRISSPYTTAGAEFCPEQSWSFTVTSTN